MGSTDRPSDNEKREQGEPEAPMMAVEYPPKAVASIDITSDVQSINEEEEQRKLREEYMAWLEENQKWLDISESCTSIIPALSSEGLKSQSEIPAIMFLRHAMKAALARTSTAHPIPLTNMATQVIAEDNPTMFRIGKYGYSKEFKSEFEKYARELDYIVDGPGNKNSIFANLKKISESNVVRQDYSNAMLQAAESFQAELGKQLEGDMEKLLGPKKETEVEVEQAKETEVKVEKAKATSKVKFQKQAGPSHQRGHKQKANTEATERSCTIS